MEITVMLTCVNSQVAPSVIAMIRSHLNYRVRMVGVAAGDQLSGFGHACCDCFYEVPFGDAADYWTRLKEVLVREGVQIIFIGSDEEAKAITAHTDELEALGCKAACSAHEVIVLSSNKHALIQRLQRSGIACTNALTLDALDDIEPQLARLGFPDRYVVIKPKRGRGSRGVKIVKAELDPYLVFTSSDFTSITHDKLREAFTARPEALRDYVLMEYLPGDKFSVDILARNGEVICGVARNNGPIPKMNPPTQLADIVFDEDVYAYAESVVNEIGHDFFVQVECGRDLDGSLKLIETNIRLDATLPITEGLELNFYHEMIDYAVTGEFRVSLPKFPKSQRRQRFFRFWQHAFLELK